MNNHKKIILPNKLPVLFVPIKNTKISTALIMFKTGSRYETSENSGIAHFIEHMFFKGTKKRPNTLDLSSELDSLGGEFNAFTAKEFTGYLFKVTNNKLAKALDIASDMLFNSKFAAEEIDRERGVIIEELNMYEDNPRMRIEDIFESCLYGDTPLGRDTLGSKENLLKFEREDLINFLNKQYGAQSACIIITGAIKTKDKKLVAKLFSKLRANKQEPKELVIEKQKIPEFRHLAKKTDQLVLSLGVRTVKINHEDEFRLKLLSIILGGSMSSRLFINLRERSSLAYYVSTQVQFYYDCGYLTTEAGVPAEKIEEAIKIILKEYKKISKEIIPEPELQRAKDIFEGRVLLHLESTDDIAYWYGKQLVNRKKLLNPSDLVKKIKKISAKELQEVAKKYFVNKNLNLAIIGGVNEKKIKPMLKF